MNRIAQDMLVTKLALVNIVKCGTAWHVIDVQDQRAVRRHAGAQLGASLEQARAILRDKHWAEDVVHEAWLKVYHRTATRWT
jgi:hypothetical protein